MVPTLYLLLYTPNRKNPAPLCNLSEGVFDLIIKNISINRNLVEVWYIHKISHVSRGGGTNTPGWEVGTPGVDDI